jgi:hypothetical protein
VPKAAVYENCDFRASEDNVRPDASLIEVKQQILSESQSEPVKL